MAARAYQETKAHTLEEFEWPNKSKNLKEYLQQLYQHLRYKNLCNGY